MSHRSFLRRNLKLNRHLCCELLEARHLLTAAIGTWERLTPIDHLNGAYARAKAQANNVVEGPHEFSDYFLAQSVATASDGGADANSLMGAGAYDPYTFSANINGPMVTAGGATGLHVTGSAYADVTPYGFEHSDSRSTADTVYAYHAPPDFSEDMEFHGHLLLDAKVSETATEDVDYATAYVNMASITINDVEYLVHALHLSTDESHLPGPNETWYVDRTNVDNPPNLISTQGGPGVRVHIEFTVPIEDLDTVWFYSAETAQADATSNGGSADLIHAALSFGWGYVTPAGEDVTSGDFNYDGVVDAEDYRLFADGSPQADVTGPTAGVPDGVVDSDDFDVWAAHLTSNNLITVTSDANSGAGTLRSALSTATSNAGHDTIVFAPSVQSITVTSELVADEVTILGPGADSLTISGGGQTRVLSATDSTIEGVTITGGNATVGGGILGDDLTLRESRVTGNTAYEGGGINSSGTLTVIDSEISDNVFEGAGGGIFMAPDGAQVRIVNSTISGNHTNPVLIGTAYYTLGGGLYVAGDASNVTITNCTVTNNSAFYGGGIRATGGLGELTLQNTIIAGNFNWSNEPDDIHDAVAASSAYNLIGSGGSGGLTDGVNHNIVLSSSESVGLAPLNYYGGTTRTHALLLDSQAIDAGDNDIVEDFDLVLDQRGELNGRIVDWDDDTDPVVDIGAVELAFGEIY